MKKIVKITKVCERFYSVAFEIGSQKCFCRYDNENNEITCLIRSGKQYTAKSVLANYNDLKEMIKTEIN